MSVHRRRHLVPRPRLRQIHAVLEDWAGRSWGADAPGAQPLAVRQDMG
ncbi:hypothetical protein [Streptomyces sp. NPDC051684]